MLKNPDSYVKESGIWIDGAADRLAMPVVEPYDNSLILIFEDGCSFSRQNIESVLMSMSAVGIDFYITRLRKEVRSLNEQISEIFDDDD